MIQDPRLADIFPLLPLVAYKRPPNIKDKLTHAYNYTVEINSSVDCASKNLIYLQEMPSTIYRGD
jgi:hypothetical protein